MVGLAVRLVGDSEVKVNGSRTALRKLEEVLSSEKGNLRGKVEMSEAEVMRVQGQDTRQATIETSQSLDKQDITNHRRPSC